MPRDLPIHRILYIYVHLLMGKECWNFLLFPVRCLTIVTPFLEELRVESPGTQDVWTDRSLMGTRESLWGFVFEFGSSEGVEG
jgi:hypothetical protein